jgi:hypothetical protein
MKGIEHGDFFLLPFKGRRRDLLVKAIQPSACGGGRWHVSNEAGFTSTVLLTVCRRVSPSVVARILKTPNARLSGAGTASALNAKLGAAGPGED